MVSRLRGLGDAAVHLGGAGLVEADRPVGGADGLEHPERAHGGGLGGELGHLEADLDVALGAEVVDLVGPDPVQVADQRRAVRQVGVVQIELGAAPVGVVVEVVDAPGRERARAADQAVDVVALVEQQLGEVGAVLAGDAGDEGGLGPAQRAPARGGKVRNDVPRSGVSTGRSGGGQYRIAGDGAGPMPMAGDVTAISPSPLRRLVPASSVPGRAGRSGRATRSPPTGRSRGRAAPGAGACPRARGSG